MSGRDSIQSLLALRKLTRAIADTVRGQMTDYLVTLTPLLRPSSVLGEYVQGGQKEPTRKAEKAFKELQGLYERVATAPPFNLPKELRAPFNIGAGGLEITPVEYAHVAASGSGPRTITVRSPLTWTLSYTEFPPSRLADLLASKLRSGEELQKVVLAFLAMHVVVQQQPSLLQMFGALHFPITTTRVPGFGDLPVTRIGVDVPTTRPSDSVIIESAELTGMDAFEEVVSIDDLSRLRDPMKERLLELAREHAPDAVSR
jgi:hypothetical protein